RMDPAARSPRSKGVDEGGAMRRALALAAILGSVGAGVAAADGGGPAPGLDYGNGIVVPPGLWRAVALSDGRTTLLESIVIDTGRVERTSFLRGPLGTPPGSYRGRPGVLPLRG